ncbi:Leukotoxin [Tepidimonas fonticaldi]|uniref:Leukotoxin n=1 Tax=Tepidimonas fonticaldi TaxID=1101373 RepID=A0A554XHQ5_9BURK|nr:DUF4214 domain-containing protein [Tepidimonas fonticaldi]TSE35328.1 Leukotoxin [Tepidimonas fonticaldi]
MPITNEQRLKLIELYIGYFNRAPEQAGLDYWSAQLSNALASGVDERAALAGIANQFYQAGLQFGLFRASDSTETLIRTVYRNVLGRDEVDPAGLAYWQQRLDSGQISRGEFVLALIQGAKDYVAAAPANDPYRWVGDYLAIRAQVGDMFARNSAGLTAEDAIRQGQALIANYVTPEKIKQGQVDLQAIYQAIVTPVGGNPVQPTTPDQPTQPTTPGGPPAGTMGDDTIVGTAGNDTIQGLAGNDTLRGGLGDDRLDGGSGADQLYGDDGNDHLLGGDGADTLYGGNGDDLLEGGDGADNLYGDDGGDTLYGDSGDDRLEGGAGDDILHGGSNNDYLEGGLGVDALYGGDGDDRLFDIYFADLQGGHYDGGAGNDTLAFNAGGTAKGGDGNDKITVEGRQTTLVTGVETGEGADTVILNSLRSPVVLDLTESLPARDTIKFSYPANTVPQQPLIVVKGFGREDVFDLSGFHTWSMPAGVSTYTFQAGATLSNGVITKSYVQFLESPSEPYQTYLSPPRTKDDHGKGFFVITGASAAAADRATVAAFLDAYGNNAAYQAGKSHYFLFNVGNSDMALYKFTDDSGGNDRITPDELTPQAIFVGVRTEQLTEAQIIASFWNT